MKTKRAESHEPRYFPPRQLSRLRSFLLVVMRAIVAACLAAGPAWVAAQTPCGNLKLICLIPTAMHTTSTTFNFFNTAFGTQIAQLPLPSKASGIVFELNRQGVYEVSDRSFGPVLSERAETIGRHRAYFSFTYQHFAFSKIDGNDMKNLPILFYFPTFSSPQVVTYTSTRVAVTVHQYVALGTFGLTDKLDLSAAVPFARVGMGVTAQGTEYSTTTKATASFSEYLPGTAVGAEDPVFLVKYALMKRVPYNVAVGGEIRLPTGDAGNYLGTGAYGLKPLVIVSRNANVTPHLNVGYQWNSHSMLATGQDGHERLLPGFLTYAGGVDIRATKRLTAIGDFLGQLYFNAPHVSTPQSVTPMVDNQPKTFSTIVRLNGSYNAYSFAVGCKARPWNNLLITANANFKLNDSGLRATVVPLGGVSYSF